MKQFYKLLAIVLIALMPSIVQGQTATAPTVGDGSAGSPYEIATLENLYWIAEDNTRWGFSYIQTADIDASSTSTWFSGAGWTPIGNATVKFTGNYDGSDHKITGLFINRPTTDYQGLFGRVDGAYITYLSIEDVDITAQNYGSGLAGYVDLNSHIVRCHIQGNITGRLFIGGVASFVTNSSMVEMCSANVNVRGKFSVGGLVGSNNSSSNIYQCYSKGTVTATTSEESYYYGGLVGENRASVSTSFSNSIVVSGMDCGGGLAGYNSGGIYSSYSTGSVRLLDWGEAFGGLIGRNDGTVANCYWDKESSGNPTSAAGTGKTTAEMKQQATYVGWDFEMLPEWQINSRYYNGYPYPSWMPTTAEPMVSTNGVDNISGTSAGATGELIGLGFTDPSQHGFCWSTSQNPTIADSKIELGSATELKPFSTPIEGLSLNTTYYLRAYATNSHGTSYGEEITFTTLPFNGAGTDVDPYQIENLNQLRLISENTGYWDKHYIQIADIDASETSTWNGGEGWSPIGNATVMFTGSYNGQSFSINNLYINRPTQENVGFFGRTFNTTIQKANSSHKCNFLV